MVDGYRKRDRSAGGRGQAWLCCLAPSADDGSRSGGWSSRYQTMSGQSDWDGVLYLPPLPENFEGKKTLVLDLDETLVHSSFQPVPNPDHVLQVEVEGVMTDVYVLKRPGLDDFLKKVGKWFEVGVYTASLVRYADPLLDLLDPHGCISWRLFREACCHYEGVYVKDLSRLGRSLGSTVIIDNSPHSYMLQPENGVPIGSFIDDRADRELIDMLTLLEGLRDAEDARDFLAGSLAPEPPPPGGR